VREEEVELTEEEWGEGLEVLDRLVGEIDPDELDRLVKEH